MPDETYRPSRDRYIRTFYGRKFHLMGDDPLEIHIADIAHALSHVGRFGGHTERFYSVGEHSLLVSNILQSYYGSDDPWLLLAGLLHDATEAYLSDIVSPFKPLLSNYHELEGRTWKRIAYRFDLNPKMDVRVKDVDWVALFAEAIALHPFSQVEQWDRWSEYGERAIQILEKGSIVLNKKDPSMPRDPGVVKRAFLARYHSLVSECDKSPDILSSESRLPNPLRA